MLEYRDSELVVPPLESDSEERRKPEYSIDGYRGKINLLLIATLMGALGVAENAVAHGEEVGRYESVDEDYGGIMIAGGVNWHWDGSVFEGMHAEVRYFNYAGVDYHDHQLDETVRRRASEILIHGSLGDLNIGKLFGGKNPDIDLLIGAHLDLHLNKLNDEVVPYFHMGAEIHLHILEKFTVSATLAPDEMVGRFEIDDLLHLSSGGLSCEIGFGLVNSHEFTMDEKELEQKFLMFGVGIPLVELGLESVVKIVPEYRHDLVTGSSLGGLRLLLEIGQHGGHGDHHDHHDHHNH